MIKDPISQSCIVVGSVHNFNFSQFTNAILPIDLTVEGRNRASTEGHVLKANWPMTSKVLLNRIYFKDRAGIEIRVFDDGNVVAHDNIFEMLVAVWESRCLDDRHTVVDKYMCDVLGDILEFSIEAIIDMKSHCSLL